MSFNTAVLWSSMRWTHIVAAKAVISSHPCLMRHCLRPDLMTEPQSPAPVRRWCVFLRRDIGSVHVFLVSIVRSFLAQERSHFFFLVTTAPRCPGQGLGQLWFGCAACRGGFSPDTITPGTNCKDRCQNSAAKPFNLERSCHVGLI